MQLLKYKFRIYPTNGQELLLNQICGNQRYCWNWFLDKEIKSYQETGKFRFYNQNAKELVGLKQELDWLGVAPACSLQQTLQYLNKALVQSFKAQNHQKGFPKFKKKTSGRSFSLVNTSFKTNFKKGLFWVNRNLGIKIKQHRDLPSDFKSCQIKQEGTEWYVVLTCEKKKAEKKPINKITGLDLNSKKFVSTDQEFVIPKPFRENQAKLKELQRSLARRTRFSKNWFKCLVQLKKVNQHCKRIMLDYFHKLSLHLCKTYDLITIEDLDVKAIQQKFGKVIQNNGFGLFRQLLEYKSELYGTSLVIADRYYPSSQLCSCCGTRQKLKLSDRIYRCDCGLSIDRDYNAAINLANYGRDAAGVDYLKKN